MIGQYPEWHSDEGYWANGPRNSVLYGDALLDKRLHPFLSPATFAALRAHFMLFTPTLVTARLLAILGIFTCVFVWLTARRMFPGRPWLPLFLFGVSGYVLITHRITLLSHARPSG